jgi:hypothetical protein
MAAMGAQRRQAAAAAAAAATIESCWSIYQTGRLIFCIAGVGRRLKTL